MMTTKTFPTLTKHQVWTLVIDNAGLKRAVATLSDRYERYDSDNSMAVSHAALLQLELDNMLISGSFCD